MSKKIISGLAVLIAILAVVISMQPEDFSVERSAIIAAPASTIFTQVNDMRNWEAWSPWANLDPNATESFEGPSEGDGSVMRWSGNHEVGEGSLTITESRPDALVRFQLDFIKPFKSTSTSQFTFTPHNGGTLVTWRMHGKNNFLAKAMSLVMDCEKMMGDYFEKGLAQLQTITERR